jgi:transcriptional regulator with XRE-family HTH domain
MTTQNDLARTIAALMDERRMSGRALGRACGWSAPYTARRLAGAVEFRASDLSAVASALEVPLADLMGGATS